MSNIGDDRENKDFSVYMADIMESSSMVEYKLATTIQAKDGNHTTAEFGGAATVGRDESSTGNVQIFVSPNAVGTAEERLSSVIGRTKSDDGRALQFTKDVIDVDEFGHAHEGLNGGDVDSTSGRDKAVRMENAVRTKQKSLLGPRRRVRE